MNDEIKEILEDLKDSGEGKYINPFELTDDSCKSLLDYITNLQQENERLRKRLTTKKLFKKYKVEKDENLELRKIFELQRRIDKAIEDIEFCLNSINQEKEMSIDGRTRNEMESCIQILNETLDILNGDNNE